MSVGVFEGAVTFGGKGVGRDVLWPVRPRTMIAKKNWRPRMARARISRMAIAVRAVRLKGAFAI